MTDGHCVFLNDDNKCWLHATFGHSTIPFTCRTYPRRYVSTPLGFFSTLTPSCHTAAALLADMDPGPPIPIDLDFPNQESLPPFQLVEGLPLTNKRFLRIETEILGLLDRPGATTARKLCAASELLTALRAPLEANDKEAFRATLKRFHDSPIPRPEGRPLSEHLQIIRAVFKHRAAYVLPGRMGDDALAGMLSLLHEVYALEDEEARPPASIRMSRAFTQRWAPGAEGVDPILLRYVRREIWSKGFTYAYGVTSGVRIVAFLYALVRVYATALASREDTTVDLVHALSAIRDVTRVFAHSQVVLGFWKGVLALPAAEKPWFLPLLVL